MPITVIYFAVAMLFVGVAPLPYDYYPFLRLVATGVFAWATFVSYHRKSEPLPWVFGFLALLFNPIFPVYLPKELWVIINIGSGLILLVTKRYIQTTKVKN